MLASLSRSQLFCPADLISSRASFEVIGVFNPGVVRCGSDVVMLVRVAERPVEQRAGFSGLPRWDALGECVVDWVPDADIVAIDPRVVQTKSDGLLRLTSVSHLRLFRRSEQSRGAWTAGPIVTPAVATEEFGIEDPRITKIDQTYWITYVAVSRHGAATALASSTEMQTFQRQGVIFCPENKDVVLFPQQLDGEYLALHRPNPHSHFSPPQIWLARSPDLVHWGKHAYVAGGQEAWESDRIGSGAPPLLIDEGWLVVYHGSQRQPVQYHVGEQHVGAYAAGLLLLDRDEPNRIVARSKEPIFVPEAAFETDGFVPNVVFPTAMIDGGNVVDVYFGAADTCVGVIQLDKQTLLRSLCWN